MEGMLGEAATTAAQKLEYPELTVMRVLVEFMSGRDTFTVLPTGFGKNFCSALLSFAFDKLEKKQNEAIVMIVTPPTAQLSLE